ncbi:hypothetical protein MTR_5g013210 [Medicago truncatula]|uniref:Uncharacterized protein n=1 Tax=Medicago truncatula TaxID=3880 RepID=G7JXG8_MEDTR|nr:hypothetical protein MTR_5g013210 [Medicago truncatula]
MDVRKYDFENLRRTQSIDWRIMILEEGFWGVTKKEGIGLKASRLLPLRYRYAGKSYFAYYFVQEAAGAWILIPC